MSHNAYIFLGVTGSVIAVLGNLPMLIHLIRGKDSTGHSLLAWYVWELASLLLLVYAVHINDVLFTTLQLTWVILGGWVIYLVIKYKKPEVLA